MATRAEPAPRPLLAGVKAGEQVDVLHRKILSRIDHVGGALDRAKVLPGDLRGKIRQLERKLAQALAEKEELILHGRSGDAADNRFDVGGDGRENAKRDAEKILVLEGELRRTKLAQAHTSAELEGAVAKQKDLQRELSTCRAELSRVRRELDLLRPYTPSGLPDPSLAPRQDEHPELEPPYSPRAVVQKPRPPRSARARPQSSARPQSALPLPSQPATMRPYSAQPAEAAAAPPSPRLLGGPPLGDAAPPSREDLMQRVHALRAANATLQTAVAAGMLDPHGPRRVLHGKGAAVWGGLSPPGTLGASSASATLWLEAPGFA